MKKITAVLLICSLLLSNLAPAYAQSGKWLKQGMRAGKQTSAAGRQASKILKRAEKASQTAARAGKVRTAARVSLLGKNPTAAQLHLRALQGKTSFLPQAILEHAVPAERADLLRRDFTAAAAEASPEEISQAAAFWRTDLRENLKNLSENAPNAVYYNALADASALGLYGTAADIQAVREFYRAAEKTPLADAAAAVYARSLLVRGDYQGLADFFAQNNGVYAPLQNGLAGYAHNNGLPVNIPATPAETAAVNETLREELAEYGKTCQLAADQTEAATAIWVRLADAEPPAAPVSITLDALGTLPAPEGLQLSAREVPAGQNTGLVAGQTAAPAGSAAAKNKKIFRFFSRKPAAQAAPVQPSAPAVENAPVVSPANAAKKAWGKIKAFFSKKTANKPAGATQSSAIQRAAIYLASYVMGLEVATPVIANFGSSFGLSLEENILVAVATYLPYSLGAFFSNWTKKVLGRKHSMNLGLALMGGGFLTGVTLCGLNGAFLPEADPLMHFYKVLGCITVASLGGVLVHNSVGPMMTELNAGASDLVRQKRSAYTEFSRALGMASSFAFPFLATKVLGMDWSLTFALPIPLVAASLLGTNFSKLPNTKPVTEATAKAGKEKVKGLRNIIKNNEYIRLFKEEKGVGAFLGGLFIMNAVEMAINSGFLFLLPSMTQDQSSQYLFGLAQFAAPFLLGRYLAGKFLQWFPKHNMSIATLMAAGGGLASLGALDNVYALTAALFLAETGISTGFTLGFARTAKNPATQDRVVSLIVASALSCAFGPLLLTKLAQMMIDMGVFSAETATAAAMIGIPSGLAVLSAMMFKRVENLGEATGSMIKKILSFIKKSVYHPKQRRKRS